MSSSTAPLFPKTSVFIPAYWGTARAETLTQEEADARYLRFPTGQGTESIPNLIVAGTSTLGITSTSNLTSGSSTLFTNMDSTSFSATNAAGSPQYNASVSANNISISNTNGDSNTLTAVSMVIDNNTSSTTYSTAGITAGEVVANSIVYSITSNQPTASPSGYARLDLTSGSNTVPPKIVLNAFQEYPQTTLSNCNNTITLGDNTGTDILIANGDGFNNLPENKIVLSQQPLSTNNYIQLRSAFDLTNVYSTLTLGIRSFNLTIAQLIAFTIGTGPTSPVVFRRNISTTTTEASPNSPVGLLENSVINGITFGPTTLTVANAFATIINTPTSGTRVFVLPAPSVGTIGYWYTICNKSTSFTIAIQYPAATTIATVPVSPSATNGGSVARLAVDTLGVTYFKSI